MIESRLSQFAETSRRAYSFFVWLVCLWAVANCIYVYLALDGTGTYRIESATILLVVVLLPAAIKAHTRDPAVTDLPRSIARLLFVAAIGLWLAIYLPLVEYPFLSDDYVFLGLYRELTSLGRTTQFFRPLFAAVFWAMATVGDGSPVPFHLLSLGLHLAAAALVYVLASRLFRSNTPATLAFTVFLLNPLQLEAVLWISGLQEQLWTFFVLAALTAYSGLQRLSLRHLLVAAALAWLALLSKETAICYLLLMPAADWIFFRFRRGRLLPVAHALFITEAAAYFLLRSRLVAMESTYFVYPSRYFIKQFLTTPYRFFSQPWNTAVTDVPLPVVCAVAVTLILLLCWAVIVRGAPLRIIAGAYMIAVSTLPAYSYFFVREDLVSSRYLYFAAFGWAVIVAELICSAAARTRTVLLASGSLALLLATSLHLNLRPWRIASDVIQTLQAGLIRGETRDSILEDWTRRTGIQLSLDEGVPTEYKGVRIFLNGYDEFLELVSRTKQR